MNERPLDDRDTLPTDTQLVRAFQALPDDYADSRTHAISSLRWACDGDDYDFIRAAGDLGGAEIDLWNTVL